jgi:hypothetical protein
MKRVNADVYIMNKQKQVLGAYIRHFAPFEATKRGIKNTLNRRVYLVMG